MTVERIITRTGVRVKFPKSWPQVRDEFDRYTDAGEPNPLFKTRSSIPSFGCDDLNVFNMRLLYEATKDSPIDPVNVLDRTWVFFFRGKMTKFKEDPRRLNAVPDEMSEVEDATIE